MKNVSKFVTGSLAIAAFILISPKWMVAPAAWIAPALLLITIHELKPWKAFLISASIIFCSSLIANYKVMPFPDVVFVIMIMLISLYNAVPYWLNRILYNRVSPGIKTLVFPVTLVVSEYVSSFGGGGTWGSIAYSQIENNYLMQTASLTGIWGITFLIGWFCAVIFEVFQSIGRQLSWKPLILFVCVITVIHIYGFVRVLVFQDGSRKTIRTAGIAVDNIPLISTMYHDAFGKTVEIPLEGLTQTSPELAELNRGFAEFISDPRHVKFTATRQKLAEHSDALLKESSREASAGATIIAWSEAATFVLKQDEPEHLQKGADFAKAHGIYFLMTMATLEPGKIEVGKKFIENKAVFFNPDGNVIVTFLKNKPVPVVEPSVAGDGKVPVRHTQFGNVGISICYDADFPSLMRQAGQQKSGLLLLPSGDWKEISPYHAQIATVRAIENGTSLLRPVSGAISIATDPFGRVIASHNFYDKGRKVLVADVPVQHVHTLYASIGDTFAWICIIALIVVTGITATKYLTRQSGKASMIPDKNLLSSR